MDAHDPIQMPVGPLPSRRGVWSAVARSPLAALWDMRGVPPLLVLSRTWRSFMQDNLAGRAAELGFFFLFALFPCLFTLTSVLGLAARSASHIYYSLLGYLSVVLPPTATGTVLETFTQITATTTSGKLTFGLVASLWSASVGFSAIQDSVNTIYRVRESRSYIVARLSAIGVTILLSAVITLILASLFGADYFARIGIARLHPHFLAILLSYIVYLISWILVLYLLFVMFAAIYYFAPNLKNKRWQMFTPGSAVGVFGWLLACMGFRIYVSMIGNYSGTYGSLGAVIILLMWFYIAGLMLLLGAEINSEIEAAIEERGVMREGHR